MKRTFAAGIVLAVLSSAAALASADAATHHARSSAKAGAFTVTATVNKSEPLTGSKIKIKGSVKPAAPGSRVILQVRYQDQKRWKSIDSTTLSAASKYKFKDKVTSIRERKYRVVKPAGAHRGTGHSQSLKVTVFGWRDLASLSPVALADFMPGDIKMNGVDYPGSLTTFGHPTPPSPPTHTNDYNLDRHCTAFRGVAGVDDRSPTAGSAQISLSTDGTLRYSGHFGLTQTAPVSFDLTNVFRLTVTGSAADGGVPALGTPQVLCSF